MNWQRELYRVIVLSVPQESPDDPQQHPQIYLVICCTHYMQVTISTTRTYRISPSLEPVIIVE